MFWIMRWIYEKLLIVQIVILKKNTWNILILSSIWPKCVVFLLVQLLKFVLIHEVVYVGALGLTQMSRFCSIHQ